MMQAIRNGLNMHMQFANRKDAGKKLALSLLDYRDRPNLIVLALPRGGVPVAAEIAKTLHAPMDLMLVRKLGVPGHKELAMGAIANGDIHIINDEIVESLGIAEATLTEVIVRETQELLRQNEVYREGKPAPNLKGRIVLLVDDGMATGVNMRAAVMAAKKQQAAYVIVAVPVASDSAYAFLGLLADEVVALQTPEPFHGVGQWYRNFSQTSDAEVLLLMQQEKERQLTEA